MGPLNRRRIGPHRLVCIVPGLVMVLGIAASSVRAQPELTYRQYRDLASLAGGLDHVVQFEPLQGETGMFFAIAERFGTVQILKADGRGVRTVWKSNQLAGIPEDVLVADLSGDGLDDALLCRTASARVYAWALDGFTPLWESLSGEYANISCFTAANVDEDPAAEIVMIADGRLVYVDGGSFTKQFTSISEYAGTQVRCGDVDGDGRADVVLNTGKVIDARSGDVKWEDESFFGKIELYDVDGNGVLEILTENPGGGPLKVYDIGARREVRFQ